MFNERVQETRAPAGRSLSESGTGAVRLRPLPFPYRAALAICSDLDGTPDREVYLEIMRFLNTTGPTSMGTGVGLEVGNSIYFDIPPGQFSYWNTDEAGREMVRTLIRSGHIDCLHSYGHLATSRAHAGRALDELSRHDCRLRVWVDHAKAPTNFGPDIMRGQGDVPGSPVYHADLTCGFGISYVWRGRATSVIGQEVPPRLGGIASARHPLASARTLAKEAAKRWLARRGDAKYAIHRPNRVMRASTLRDGRPVYEFLRCNPHWGGVSSADTGRRIGEVLTKKFLDRLVERQGVCILYTHLGRVESRERPFGPGAVEGFRRLAEYARRREILVTTTRRLLEFHRTTRELRFTVNQDPEVARGITISLAATDDHTLDGITWYVPVGAQVRISRGDAELGSLVRNAPDATGLPSVALPWRGLTFPGQRFLERSDHG